MIDAGSRRLGANEGRIGGAGGDKTRRQKTSQNRLRVCYHVLEGGESGHQGEVALIWKEDDPKWEIKSVLFNNGPNISTFQLATGDERFYVIGIYIPPDCIKGVDNLRRAWDACPPGCKPVVLGDLNIKFGFPRDEREEVLVDLLDKINLIDTSCKY